MQLPASLRISGIHHNAQAESSTPAIAVPVAAVATTDVTGLFLSLQHESMLSI